MAEGMRFIRKNGRIIPIGGKRKKNKKISKKKYQANRRTAVAGAVGLGVGVGTGVASSVFRAKAVVEAANAKANASIARVTASKKHADKAVSLFNKHLSSLKTSKKLRIVSTAGLAVTGVAIGLNAYRNRRK